MVGQNTAQSPLSLGAPIIIIRICAGWQIPILHTRDGEHTARVIQRIASQDLRQPAGPIRPRPRNPAYAVRGPVLQVVTSIPGIGVRRGLSLLKHFQSVSGIFAAERDELLKVPGIGPTHAATIMALNKAYAKT